ncbi:MAG: response regulator [Desulfuromonas sp.]|nr:response regulator [Desulfuromonas sp.]
MTNLRVLIIEDDPRIAQLHQRFCEKISGFDVVGIALSISEAREMADILEPDLLLLDLFLPDGYGMDLLNELRAAGQEIDVILITAAKEVAAVQQALRGGAFDYIVKPAIFGRFEEALHKFSSYRSHLLPGETLEQSDIDQLLHAQHAPTTSDKAHVPKGIDPLTLNKIQQVFNNSDNNGLSAEEVGAEIGASRSTARRYLEYMVSTSELSADVVYGNVGRPERKYFRHRP